MINISDVQIEILQAVQSPLIIFLCPYSYEFVIKIGFHIARFMEENIQIYYLQNYLVSVNKSDNSKPNVKFKNLNTYYEGLRYVMTKFDII